MSSRAKLMRNIGIGIAALLVILFIAGTQIVQTQWFRSYVAAKIITATEDATGGKVEIGSFAFDWTRLEAVITNFVIHGTEPAGAEPFVRAARVQVNIRLFTSFKRFLEVSYLGVDRPAVNVLIAADGSTNVPAPKTKGTSKSTPLETIVDLAIGRFDLANGIVKYNQQPRPLDVRAQNLRAQLAYSFVQQGYQGRLDLQPLYIVSGRQTPVVFTISLPVIIQKDRIDFTNAKITTPASDLTITGSLNDLRDPKTSAKIQGHIAVADLQKLGDLQIALNASGPKVIDINGGASAAANTIKVDNLKVGIGDSNITASGTLKDPRGQGALDFQSHLAVDELGRFFNIAQKPSGAVDVKGTAKLDAANNYQVAAGIDAKNIAFQQGQQRLQGIALTSKLDLNPQNLNLTDLKLLALGGDFTGAASLNAFRYARLNGTLHNLDLQTAARAFGVANIVYSGVASGPLSGQADLKGQGTQSVQASTNLSLAPGRRGIPLSGRINAKYNGGADDVNVTDSYLALPHTRLTLDGSLKNRLNLDLTSQDLNDLLASVSSAQPPPVKLIGGLAHVAGSLTGSLSAPHIAAHVSMNRFAIEDRAFDSVGVDIDATKARASVANGSLLRGPMQAQFAASVGLVNWSPAPTQMLAANASVRNGDLADMLVLAGRPSAGFAGPLTADVNITGTVGNPQGSMNLQVASGTLQNEPFDRIQAQVNLTDQLVTIPAASLVKGPSELNLAAEYRHPSDSFTTGNLHAHVKSDGVELASLLTLQQQRPNTAGRIDLDLDANGTLAPVVTNGESSTQFALVNINGKAGAKGLRFEGETYGDVNATASTSGNTVSYNLTSNFAGSNLRANGNTRLAPDYPTTLDANLSDLPIQRLLKLAKRTDIQAKGNLSGTAHYTGTVLKPEGNVDLQLANAVVYDEPLDRVQARVTYLADSIDVANFEVNAGRNRIQLTAHYAHPVGNLRAGDLTFHTESSNVDLARLRSVQNARPGLGGTVQLNGDGSAKIAETSPQVLIRAINADIKAAGLSASGQNFGDVTLKATTTGDRVNFALDSNLASAAIQGRGDAQLAGDYPLNARLTFNNVTWNRLKPILGKGTGQPDTFDAATEGEITMAGPVLNHGQPNAEQLHATFRLSKLQVRTIPTPGAPEKPMALQNDGDILATLDRGLITINSAHIKGPQTDINAAGTASLVQRRDLNLSLNANTNLGILQDLSRDIFSSGNVSVNAAVRGTMDKPLINGRAELKNASVNYSELPNGISNANGAILFNGNTATIQNLTGESGGGKITLAGFATVDDTIRLGLRANAFAVRVRAQQGVSVVVSSNVRLTGTSQASLASGTVTIDRITYAPQSDFGSILTSAAPPVQAPVTPNAVLDNMKLDIRVVTSNTTAVQASIAQNLQLDADLRVRGTAARPGLLGRINITNGDLVFFGSTYAVNNGSVSFFNTARIEPILNIALETQAKGVNVVLNVTGPIDNMKLTYTSDPPLQFQEIATLLASGKAPTSDPTILANQPSAPQQSYQQMGESAIVGKALADPVASRLKRVFGVSQLKIDPTFASGSELPQANVTLQQQVATNLVFTYVTALNGPNATIIRAEYSINPQWSAVADRDQNGIVSLNFLYKKQFR